MAGFLKEYSTFTHVIAIEIQTEASGKNKNSNNIKKNTKILKYI